MTVNWIPAAWVRAFYRLLETEHTVFAVQFGRKGADVTPARNGDDPKLAGATFPPGALAVIDRDNFRSPHWRHSRR
jgi:hypothetical protein